MTTQEMTVVGLQIARPEIHRYNEQEVLTGIYKRPVRERVQLRKLSFDGDAQADLKHHGGPDKAVCVYCAEHYPYWEQELNRPLEAAAFGENLTVFGLLETDVCLGDIYQIGDAVLQVSQPRQPCHKLAKKHAQSELPLLVQNTGYTGFYFRVLEEGAIAAGDSIRLMQRHPLEVTVDYANQIMHHNKQDANGLKRILEVAELSASWRDTLSKRLLGIETDVSARLNG